MTYLALLPPALMALFACATLLLGVVSRRTPVRSPLLVSFNLAGQLLAGYSLFRQAAMLRSSPEPVGLLANAVTIDALALFSNALVWFSVVGLLLISYRYLEEVRENAAEYYALALFAQCGMYFMCSGADLIALVLGIELTAVSFYILVGFTRTDRRSNEAALKYLLLGAISSAFVLYGFSILYGVTGSTAVSNVVPVLAGNDAFAALAAVAVISGLLLKVSAVPFHTWAPDAYDGAATPVTGYLSVASKISAFAVLLRLFANPIAQGGTVSQPFIVIAAVLSLTIGSIAAITQERVKRLFAYSGVAHAGYVLLGIIAGSRQGVYIYLLTYALMNLGAFALLTSLRHHGIAGDNIEDLRGLSRTHPVHAALFTLLVLSLAGIPPSAGFIGKYYIFAALIGTHHIALAVVAASYVVVSAFFYFRLVREMYLEPALAPPPIAASFGIRIALGATSAATLLLGLFPEPMLRSASWLTGVAR